MKRKRRSESRKRPPDPRDERVQRLKFYAESPTAKKRHCDQARNEAVVNRKALMQEVAERDGGLRCACCGSTYLLRLDHIRPVSKGGRTVLENLQLLCRRHDVEKGNQIIDYRPKPEKG